MEPMLQWAKTRTAAERRQVVPCRAGFLNAVVYSNGDVSVCETHPPVGNLRQQSFQQIWRSEKTRRLRDSIRAKECWCTNEMFLWPSINYQPVQLANALIRSRAWRKPAPSSSARSGSTSGAPPPLEILE